MDARPGTYALILRCDRSTPITVGRLGELVVLPGFYAYVGSAFGAGGVAGRLGHHARVSDRPRWHIDHLRRAAAIREIWCSHDPERREHVWAEVIASLRGGSVPLRGFGTSDCRCRSHLFFFASPPSFSRFCACVHRTLRGHRTVHRIGSLRAAGEPARASSRADRGCR